jgi:predicted membrane protein
VAESESIVAVGRPKLKVVRAVLFGIGAELLTILSIVLAITVYRLGGHTAADIDHFSARAGLVIGPAGGAVYTFVMALASLRGISDRFVVHGLVVGAGAAAFHLLGVTHAPGGFQPIYLYADVAKLAAGAVAGYIIARQHGISR